MATEPPEAVYPPNRWRRAADVLNAGMAALAWVGLVTLVIHVITGNETAHRATEFVVVLCAGIALLYGLSLAAEYHADRAFDRSCEAGDSANDGGQTGV